MSDINYGVRNGSKATVPFEAIFYRLNGKLGCKTTEDDDRFQI